MSEADTPPAPNTFRKMIWQTVAGLSYLRAYWGRRLAGGALGLIADLLGEGATQAFYARLPGHPEQAPDSLDQSSADRDLNRFRGEDNVALAARVRAAWADYDQGGTKQQLLRVINQWGLAGWPLTWDPTGLTFSESADPLVFTFTLTIAYGLIMPPWTPALYGGPYVYGEGDLFYGIGPSTDIPMLLYLVRKWKPSRSKGFVQVFYDGTHSVTFTV